MVQSTCEGGARGHRQEAMDWVMVMVKLIVCWSMDSLGSPLLLVWPYMFLQRNSLNVLNRHPDNTKLKTDPGLDLACSVPDLVTLH
jgi:hypothetical protein